jgi:protein phosphatase PTC7
VTAQPIIPVQNEIVIDNGQSNLKVERADDSKVFQLESLKVCKQIKSDTFNVKTKLAENFPLPENLNSIPDNSKSPTKIASVEESSHGLYFERGFQSIPHPKKKERGSEDSFFTWRRQDRFAFGVADGVGGWSKSGINPGIFANGLMRRCGESAKHFSCPVALLRHGLDHVLKKKIQGSSTALVALVDKGRMEIANIGDSGIMVLRGNREEKLDILYRSVEQQHAFNKPYQLGLCSSDKPEDACRASVQLEVGDVVIAATDGLFDNLHDKEIIESIEHNLNGNGADFLAKELAKLAFDRSLSKSAKTPFAEKAKNVGFQYEGGKSDDITIFVFLLREDK